LILVHKRIFIRGLKILSLTLVAVLTGSCGGESDGNNNTSIAKDTTCNNLASNQVCINVNSGIANIINVPTVSVTLCAPGSQACQTIDNVLVDTGSYGLRIISAAAANVLASLPIATATNGQPLATCGMFVASYTWGSVRIADVNISGKRASALPVQIIGDLNASNVPESCSNGGSAINSAQDLGANGVLGIGPAQYDCGALCTNQATVDYSNYYTLSNNKSAADYSRTIVPLNLQIANPVPSFTTDNNGVIVQMNKVPDNGQASATGVLTFGIGTQPNNQRPTTAVVLNFMPSGNIQGTFLGRSVEAFFDTGSNGYFFDDRAQPQSCPNSAGAFYCQSQTYTAALGSVSPQSTITMPVADASTLLNRSTYAFNNLGGSFGDSRYLDLGLPFFYDKTLYYGMGQPNGQGAYVAF